LTPSTGSASSAGPTSNWSYGQRHEAWVRLGFEQRGRSLEEVDVLLDMCGQEMARMLRGAFDSAAGEGGGWAVWAERLRFGENY